MEQPPKEHLAAPRLAKPDEGNRLAATDFPVVGIGASAGGLKAFIAFFRALPTDSGMAFVLVPHLDPNHDSMLVEILQRNTEMPVAQALDQIAIVPDHVYIIPPNRMMTICNGVLLLTEPELPRGQRMAIDHFLRSLAEDQAGAAIGIILSGTATDGTLGLRAILGAGGVCMVQEPSTASYDGMPRSAIDAGYATHVLPVERMPAMLQEITRQPTFKLVESKMRVEKIQNGLNQILLQLRSETGHDFSLYKKSTICRRIERRMAHHNIEDTPVYARFLQDNPAEMQKLFKELLINVTSFFRDPEAFTVLKDRILPPLLENKPDGYAFRIWVAGCATGEEAYSIAMILVELQDRTRAEHQPQPNIQIYATDLDEDAIMAARIGRYSFNIAKDISPERLQRFFTSENTGYKIRKEIRDMVVFAVQSVIKDPPFTRLDLLSCRNLMIYLEPEQQNRLIPTFNFALKPGGVLFLSTSESITNHPELFSPLDRKWKFYRARHSVTSTRAMITNGTPWTTGFHGKATGEIRMKNKEINFEELTRRALLQSFAPAAVVTDLKGNILFVYGDTSRFLSPPPGPVSNNVIDMARDGLQLELRSQFHHASDLTASALNREVQVKTLNGFSTVSLGIRRMPTQYGVMGTGPEADGNLLLISFQDRTDSDLGADRPSTSTRAEVRRIEQLERELTYAIESQQAFAEEQQAFNEELQSANEELQSSNEELETSKEELHSLNEEMVTVNSELNAKIEQLSDMQNDMKNLLDSLNSATLFLDHQLVIRRYTPQALKIYRLVGTDLGRPLADIKSNLEEEDLQTNLQTVLDTLIPIEREVRTLDRTWYLARMQPYRTLDHVIAGVVLTFTDVNDFKLASEAVQRSVNQLATAQAIARLGSWELEVATGQMTGSNEMFKLFSLPPEAASISYKETLNFLTQEDRQRAMDAMQATMEDLTLYDIEYRVTRPDGSTRDVRSRGIPIPGINGRPSRVVGTTLDITEIKEAARIKLSVEQLARDLAEGIVNTVTEPLIVLDGNLTVISASNSFYAYFCVAAEDTVGRKIYNLGNGQWDIPALRQLLDDLLPQEQALNGYVVEHNFPDIGMRRMVLNARRIATAMGTTEMILLAMVAIAQLETHES